MNPTVTASLPMRRYAANVSSPFPHPVFVGGTGRSGTTVLGRLIGRHTRYAFVRVELRIHTLDGGLADLFAGRTDPETFMARVRDFWYFRTTADGQPRGIRGILPEARMEALLAAFAETVRTDEVAAGRALVTGILEPLAAEAKKPSWVEQTPTNTMAAGALYAMFPDMKLVQATRDGRDVASSVVSMGWGPKDPMSALEWWDARLREAHASTAALPEDRLLLVALEDLVGERRHKVVRDMLAFLDAPDEFGVHQYLDTEMPPSKANLGRWREGMSAKQQEAFDARFQELSAAQREAGIRGAAPEGA